MMDKSYSFIFNDEFKDYQYYSNNEESYFNFFEEINQENEDKTIQNEYMEKIGSLNQEKEIIIENNIFLDDIKSKETFLGRKMKCTSEKKRYGKYEADKIIKKIKSYLLTCLVKFVNFVLKERYNDNIGHNIFQKQLLKINKKKILSSKNNNLLLNKTLKEIFSEEISTKYSNFYENHNRDLIQKLLNEKDEEKRLFFNKLFNLTFIECLKHFRGSENIVELNGLESLDNILKKFKNDKDYIDNFKYFVFNFEEIIFNKRKKK